MLNKYYECVKHPWVSWHKTIRLNLQLVSHSWCRLLFILSSKMFHFSVLFSSLNISLSKSNISAEDFKKDSWQRTEQYYTNTIIYVGADAFDGLSENFIMPKLYIEFYILGLEKTK